MRPTGSPAELERRRRRAVELRRAGFGTSGVAERVGASPGSVRRWWAAYCKDGDDGLDPVPHPGRPLKLDPYRRTLLEKQLLKGARAHGFDTDLWTCPRIAELIERRYGVVYHHDYIGRLLASMGWSCQKPKRRAIERDEEAIERWVKTDWPRIKTTHRASGRTSSSRMSAAS